ncbi:jg26951 [Pararge aegeria aegeria]|uniref:Jg26951 protein n=1 Tax=Pararge aegeria aegeria TaxID=348720 RepID=A0A8S4R0Z0_9NEOP|nr:jg26951 [Pararge aegeria aegeria]
MSDLDIIFKALRLVPEFDGNSNTLTRFMKHCDQLVTQYANGPEINQLGLINGILNKISGPAARLINTNGIPTDWAGIRNALINNFSDQRNEIALYNDLSLLTQGSSTPQEFYERCQNLFSIIMTYVSLHDTLQTTIEAKRDLYKKLTLQAYLRGLKEPLRSRIRCMRLDSIEKALEFVHEEVNTMYLQSRNDHMPEKKPTSQPLPLSNQPIRNFNSNPIVPYFKPMNFNMPSPSRPQYMHQAPPQFNQFRLPISQPRGPTRTQHMFSAPLPGNNQRSAVFKLPPKPHGSTAMSGVSHFANKPLPPSGWNWAKQGNPPPSNYFKARDVNLNECSNYVDYYQYPDHYDYFYDPNDGIDYSDQYYDCYPYEFDTSHDMTNNCNAQTTREPQQPEAETNEDFREESKSNRLK